MSDESERPAGFKQKLVGEMVEYWTNVVYLIFCFVFITNYRRLILLHYGIVYESYGIAVIKALVMAKVIMIADKVLHMGRSFEGRPLIIPTMYNSVIFTICLMVFTIIESLIHSLLHWKGSAQAWLDVQALFTYEWLAGILVLFVAFIPYFGVRELGRVVGRGWVRRLFFQGPEAAGINLIQPGERH